MLEERSSEELRQRLQALRRQLIDSLLSEAQRLDNQADVESLTAAKSDDSDFELSSYWGYDTRSDAPTSLREQVKEYEQLEGILIERDAALEVQREEQQKRRRGYTLIGSIVAVIVVASLWARFAPNRFRVDIRTRQLKKLKFLPSFASLSGIEQAALVQKLAPPPVRMAPRYRSYKAYAALSPASLYGLPRLWLLQDDKGQTQQIALSGDAPRIVRRRLLELLEPKALTQEPFSTTGLLHFSGPFSAEALTQLRAYVAANGVLKLHALPLAVQAKVRRQIAQAIAGKQALKLTSLHKLSQGFAWVPVQRMGQKKPLELRVASSRLKLSPPKPVLSWIPKAQRRAFEPIAWDAMLRGVHLPLEPLQQPFSRWSAPTRQRLWLELYRQMLSLKLPIHALKQGRIGFRVKTDKGGLRIQPLWLVDLVHDELKPGPGLDLWRRTRAPSPPAAASSPRPKPPAMGMFVAQFPKLHTDKGVDALAESGGLFQTFASLWRSNVPVHPQLLKAKDDFFPVFARLGKAILRIQMLLRTISAQRRAAAYLLDAPQPQAGVFFGWLSQAAIRTKAAMRLISQVRGKLGMISYHTPIRNDRLRLQMARWLEDSCARRMKEIQGLLDKEPLDAPPMRLARARFLHEQGRFVEALRAMLRPTVPLAFLHPHLRFKVLKGDWKGPVARFSASLDQSKTHDKGTPQSARFVLKASSDKSRPLVPVLELTGLSGAESHRLLQTLNGLAAKPLGLKLGPASQQLVPSAAEQLLLLPLEVRQDIKQLYAFLSTPSRLQAMAMELAYGCHPPNEQMLFPSSRCRHPFFRPPSLIRFQLPVPVKGRVPLLRPTPRRMAAPALPRDTKRRRGLIQVP